MDFGIAFASYIRSWEDVKRAEDYGFSHAWFYDSHMLYSDVYASMALAAEHTSRIKLGTLVSILGNRIAPVTAHSIATINELAPGRVILGVGTGFTGRNVMGMPPITLKTMREHVEVELNLLHAGTGKVHGFAEFPFRRVERRAGHFQAGQYLGRVKTRIVRRRWD